MPAYVYLIAEVPHAGETCGPWTKIGFSQNPPEWRMNANLKRGNPRDIVVAAAFEFESNQEARAAEKKAHLHFQKFKHQKEWFSVEWKTVAEWFQSSGAVLRKVVVE